MADQRRALFLSHGGGPLPLLGDSSHGEMVTLLKKIAATLEPPSAIIVVSAHWEAPHPSITAGPTPPLIYDYTGFPQESYEITYPCPGQPQLAQAIAQHLERAGFDVGLNSVRGFDHGLFVPLKIMYPEANISCVQLSLIKSLDPTEHINLGRALQGLGDSSLLLMGSGFSFHNMKAFFSANSEESMVMNQGFETWLLETCSSPDLTEVERTERLIQWESAPFARYCHPREEHLLPLHVCYGFTESACSVAYPLSILRKQASMYLWT